MLSFHSAHVYPTDPANVHYHIPDDHERGGHVSITFGSHPVDTSLILPPDDAVPMLEILLAATKDALIRPNTNIPVKFRLPLPPAPEED